MQALLLSPATHYSPDSSSDSSFGSPSTPPLPSLDFLNQSPSSPSGSSFATATQGYDTPTRPPQKKRADERREDGFPTPQTPAWLTDELGEEWVPQPGDAAGGSPPEAPSFVSTAASNSTQATVVAPPPPAHTPAPAPYSSFSLHRNTAPRVPSSLRHGFTASTASSAVGSDATGTTDISAPDGGEGESVVVDGTSVLDFATSAGADASVFLLGSSLPPSAHAPADQIFAAAEEASYEENEDGAEREEGEEEGASTGSCVVNSIIERSGSGSAGRGGTQLKAAVQALRGPGGGILAEADEGDDFVNGGQQGGDEEKGQGKKLGGKVGGGLMGLFEPPSPDEKAPPPRLPSSLPTGPSLQSFTFSPPSPPSPASSSSPNSPNTSHANSSSRWRDLMHFSPSPPPKPANPTLRPPSSTPPNPAHIRREPPPLTPGYGYTDDEGEPTPIAYRPPPTGSYRTPAVGVAGMGTPAPAVATVAAGGGPHPPAPTGPARKERFLHRSTTTSRLGASTTSSLAASTSSAAPPRAVSSATASATPGGFTDEDDEEDVPFVPPPVSVRQVGLGELGSEEMSTASSSSSSSSEGSLSNFEQEEEEERDEREEAGQGWSGSVVVREEGEEEGFTTSESERDEEEGDEAGREPHEQEEQEDLEGGVEEEEEVSLPSRSMSALPSPPPIDASPSDSVSPAFSFSLSATSPPFSNPPATSTLPLPKSPARIPFVSPSLPASSQMSSSAAVAPAPQSPYKLFQPTYDTVTRIHLLSLVDEIDSLSATPEALARSLLEGAPPPPVLAQREGEDGEEEEQEHEQDTSEEGFLGAEGAVRSSKRIKLSPRTEFAARAGEFSTIAEEDEETEELGVATPLPSNRRHRRERTKTRTPPYSALSAPGTRHRRTPGFSSARPQLRRGQTPFSPADVENSPATARSARSSVRSAHSPRLPALPSPLPLSSSVSTAAYHAHSRPQTPSSTSTSFDGQPAGLAPPSGAGVTKSAKSRERLREAEAVMERIRGLVERREGRRKTIVAEGVEATTTPRPARSPLKRASPGSSPSSISAAEVDGESYSHLDQSVLSAAMASDSPPPLPHLAAAASASLRATLSNSNTGSPLPSPNPNAATFSSTATTTSLAGSSSPALGTAPRLPGGLPAEKAGSIGRRHFARTPLSAKKNDRTAGAGQKKEKGEGRGLLGLTKGVRGLWGTEEEDHLQQQQEAEEADAEENGSGDQSGEEEQEEPEQEEKDDVPSLPTVSSSKYNSLSDPSSTSSSGVNTVPSRRGHARGSSLTTLHPASLQTQRLLASAGASAREKGLVFDDKVGRWIRTPSRMRSAAGIEALPEEMGSPSKSGGAAAKEQDEDDEEDPFRDFSELRSSHSLPAPIASAMQHQSQPQETISNLDLDAIPRAGDGSATGGSLNAHALDLSGLGITKGTPPSLVLTTRLPSSPAPRAPSPANACYFSPPPAQTRPAGEGEDGPELVLESEDSATWGRGADRQRMKVEGVFDPRVLAEEEQPQRDVQEADVEEDTFGAAETSMLSLYKAAHGAPLEGEEEQEDDMASDVSSSDVGTLVSRHGTTPSQQPPLTHRPPSIPSAVPSAPRSASVSSTAHNRQLSSTPPRPAAPPAPLPRSALKQPIRSQSAPITTTTPLRNHSLEPKVPRSVSFSDGKTSGKIEGLVPLDEQGYRPSPLSLGRFGGGGEDSTLESMLEGPGELEFDERFGQPQQGAEDADRTVTQDSFDGVRRNSMSAALEELARGANDSPFSRAGAQVDNSTLSAANVSYRRRSFTRTNSAPIGPTNGNANATFLTECSFGVSHDRILQYITDVEPFEPDWEGLKSIDLSGKKAESVVRMKEFLPSLDEVNLNNNQLTYLTGAPATLRTLLVSSNLLSSLTSFQHFPRLERLDLSHNDLDSVHQLACLVHLRELKADGNQIRSLDGLGGLDALVKVSLKGNHIQEVDLAKLKWSRLETLHLARNKISTVRNLDKLVSLSSVNLDHNLLTSLEVPADMPHLRVLRLCHNPIEDIDVAFAPKLRTIYIDSARLGTVHGTEQLRKLENLSVRDQSGGAMTLSMPHIRDVKRLYLSGNPLPRSFPSEKFFNLVYLELAMCQLTSLPDNLASVIPNVRVLTLDYNFIDDLAPLEGLSRMTKLSAVGARLSKARPVAKVLSSLVELETVDLRMNPFTLAFYPPVVPSSEGLLPSHTEHRIVHPDDLSSPNSISDPSTSSKSWQVLDTKFRRALPDEWYHKRAAYRAVVLQSVPTLVRLDGIDCAKERPRLAKRLEKLASKQAKTSEA
ncbi:hypothetical protein JCM11251_006925 [Rhodosporidiobolus azoricus]